MNLILKLSLVLICVGFTESYELECFNDYDQEMVCKLSSEKLTCSEYTLNVSINEKFFTCRFEHLSTEDCDCKIQVSNSFVIGEKLKATLLRGENVLFKKEINTEETIKPKRPTIVSVNLTENENLKIFLDINYAKNPFKKTFVESLTIELVYRVKGSTDNMTVFLKPDQKKELTEYELVGRNLQPNSDYVMMARVSTGYNSNTIFSDYSEPYEFSTSSSTKSLLKIIIPILCVILISFIATIFYCYIKIIKQWWDKIPTPKIVSSFEKWVPLRPDDFSPVILETSKLVHLKNDKKQHAEMDASPENSFSSVEKGSSSGEVIYAETRPECELEEDYKSADRPSDETVTERDFGNSSSLSFNNEPYFQSETSGSPSSKITMDFNYRSCDGCSADTTQFTSSSFETEMIADYKSVKELLDQRNQPNDQTFITYNNDVNLIMAKTIPKGLQDVSACENVIIPVDAGYQSFASLDQNTWSSDHSPELEENVCNMSCSSQQVHTPLFKSVCGPGLHISPGIQIDCSYQRV